MKRALLIVVSALALGSFLLADLAWPKASIAEEIPAPAPAAEAASTAEATPGSVPKEADAEASAEAASEHNDESAADKNVNPASEN
jgi:hypothetical protein